MKSKRIAASLFAAVAVTALLAVPASAQEEQPSIAEVATEAGNFTTLLAALDAADLASTFADCNAGPFTVFAPTDDAFAAALSALGLTAEELLADTETLTTILTYHVVDGAVLSSDVVALDGQSVPTLSGESVQISVNGDAVMVNDSNVVAVDLEACNGVVHVIDAVLVPPSIAGGAEPAPTTTAAPTSALPNTGVESGVLALIGASALLGGAVIFGVTRRIASSQG